MDLESPENYAWIYLEKITLKSFTQILHFTHLKYLSNSQNFGSFFISRHLFFCDFNLRLPRPPPPSQFYPILIFVRLQFTENKWKKRLWVSRKNFLSFFNYSYKWQKQLPRGVLEKRCSENMQQICRITPMLKCDFNKVAVKPIIALSMKN